MIAVSRVKLPGGWIAGTVMMERILRSQVVVGERLVRRRSFVKGASRKADDLTRKRLRKRRLSSVVDAKSFRDSNFLGAIGANKIRRPKQWPTTLLILILVISASIGCGGSAPTAGPAPTTSLSPPKRGGHLVVGVPVRGPEAVLHLTLEGLTALDSDGSPKPFLAESVEPNATFDRWTIRVRPGIVFHNGEQLDAEAVKANLDLYSSHPLYKTDALGPIRSTTVVDDRTVSVELSTPWPSLPTMLSGEAAFGVGLIIAPETIKKSGVLILVDPKKYSDLFGTGPFVVDAVASTETQWLGKRNEKYWQSGLPYLDEVEIRAVPDAADRASMLAKGELDVAVGIGDLGASLGADRVIRNKLEPQKFAIALNTRRAPLNDPRMREAVTAAIDVEGIAKSAGVDRSQIAAGPYSTKSPWFTAVEPRQTHDAARAKELVAAYEKDNGPVSITLDSFPLEQADRVVPQKIAEQWQAAGVDVKVAVVDPVTLNRNLVVSTDFDAVVEYFFGMPDPDVNYIWWHSSARVAENKTNETKNTGTNFVGLNDPALDKALEAFRASTNDADRRSANTQVQARLASQMGYVWLWDRPFQVAAIPSVRGLSANPLPGGGTRAAIIERRLNFEGVSLER